MYSWVRLYPVSTTSHTHVDDIHEKRKAMTKTSSFWQSVSKLAAMRAQIPEERRALAGVRHWLRHDLPLHPVKKSTVPVQGQRK